MCHGHAGTVVIIKVKGTGEILGGYNPLMWDNTKNESGYMRTTDSFIFLLKKDSIQNSVLSRVKKPEYALYYYGKTEQNITGPYFGGGFYLRSFQSDFTIDNESGSYRTNEKFSIIDYEVFKVNRKTTSI
ncbi:hypothetical protein Glove_166g26 [Diversispora epigaea]|uniref:TLDc domain-containing protein n=1 Tax=Diversispora epigaea TaxID=1348612 RepID=A0A397IQV9_9GLOM|nr:hypothetical protein Glove_166g26 [Diversispora epigaea]